MASKKKKQRKNAFSVFLDEYVKMERKKGRDISHKIGAEECAGKWNELPEEEKEYYRQLSFGKRLDSNYKQNKFTCTGISYAEVEESIKKAQEKIENEDKEIKKTVHHLDYHLLKTQLFYIVHCNYYCVTSDGNYIPGEIAISEFSLGDGLRRTFHTLVNPGNLPLGFAYEAKTNIDIHGLPFPPYPEGDSDSSTIYHNILKFLKPGKLTNGKFYPLYCLENNVRACENIFGVLSDNDRYKKNNIRIFLLHKLLFWLKNKCVQVSNEGKDNLGFPVMSNAIIEIEKDIFRYVTGISCVYHCNIEEKYHNCSLSVVVRFVYVICDHCCHYIDIKLIPGKHCRMYPDMFESTTLFNNEIESKPKQKHVRNVSRIDDICSTFGESNVPSRTEVTSVSLTDENLPDSCIKSLCGRTGNISIFSRGRGKPTFTSVTAGRGKFKNLFNFNIHENDFPELMGRGKRIFRP